MDKELNFSKFGDGLSGLDISCSEIEDNDQMEKDTVDLLNPEILSKDLNKKQEVKIVSSGSVNKTEPSKRKKSTPNQSEVDRNTNEISEERVSVSEKRYREPTVKPVFDCLF